MAELEMINASSEQRLSSLLLLATLLLRIVVAHVLEHSLMTSRKLFLIPSHVEVRLCRDCLQPTRDLLVLDLLLLIELLLTQLRLHQRAVVKTLEAVLVDAEQI